MILQKQHNYIKIFGFVLILIGITDNTSFADELEAQYARIKTLLLQLDTLNSTTAIDSIVTAIGNIQTTLNKSIEDFIPSFSISKISQSTGVPTPPPVPEEKNPQPGLGNPPPPPPNNNISAQTQTKIKVDFKQTQTKIKVDFKQTTQPKPNLPSAQPLTKTTYPGLVDFYYQNVFLEAKDYDFTLLNITQNGNYIEKTKLYTEEQRNAFLKAYQNRVKVFEEESKKLKKIIDFIVVIVFNFTKNYLKNPKKTVETTQEPFTYLDKHLRNLKQRQRNKLQLILNSINLPDGAHTFDNLIEDAIKNKIAYLETLCTNPKQSLAHANHAPLLNILYHFFQQDQDNAKQQALDYIADLTVNKTQTDADATEEKNERIKVLISTINTLTAQIGLSLTIEHEIIFANNGSERLNEIIEQMKQKELIFAKSLKTTLDEKFPISMTTLDAMQKANLSAYTSYAIKVKNLTNFPKTQAYRNLITSLENLKKYTRESPESSITPTLAKSLKTPLITVIANTDDIPQINNYYSGINLDIFEDTISDEALIQIEEMIAQQMQGNATEDIIKIETTVLEEIIDNKKEIQLFNTQISEESSKLDNTFDNVEEQSTEITNRNMKTQPTSNNVSVSKNNLKKTPTTPSNRAKPNTEKQSRFPQNNLKPNAPDGDNSLGLELLKKTISMQESKNNELNQQKKQLEIQLEAKNKTLQVQNNTISTLEEKIKQLQQQNTLLQNKSKQEQSAQNQQKKQLETKNKTLQEQNNTISTLEEKIKQLQQQNTLLQNKSKQEQLAQSTQNDSEATIADLRKQLKDALDRPRGGGSSGFSFVPISANKLETITQNDDSTSQELKSKEAQIKTLENHVQLLTAELNNVRTQKEHVQVKDTPTSKKQTDEFFEETEEDHAFLQNWQDELKEKQNKLLEMQKQIELRTEELNKREKALKLKEKSKTITVIKEPKKEKTQKKTTKKLVEKPVVKNKISQ